MPGSIIVAKIQHSGQSLQGFIIGVFNPLHRGGELFCALLNHALQMLSVLSQFRFYTFHFQGPPETQRHGFHLTGFQNVIRRASLHCSDAHGDVAHAGCHEKRRMGGKVACGLKQVHT